MEAEKSIVEWALNRRLELGLNFTQMRWTNRLVPGWTDLEASINLFGEKWIGRATAIRREDAFAAALSEAMERCISRVAGVNSSNGIASHTVESLAKDNCIAELIERDRFLCHFYTNTPFHKIPDYESKLPVDLSRVVSKLSSSGIEFFFFQTRPLNNFFILGCFVTGIRHTRPFGSILGLGSSKNLDRALEKSLIEALRNIAWVINDYPMGMSLWKFMNIEAHDPHSHRLLALDIDYTSRIIREMTELTELDKSLSTEVNNISCERLHPVGLLEGAPIYVYRAVSSDLQDLFWGPPKKSNFNWKRLRSFSNCNLEMGSLQQLPHPVG